MIHIHAPRAENRIVKQYCPTCEKQRYMVLSLYEWYGPTLVCLKCGERWNEEGREQRPFCRGWRKMRVEQAKRFYRRQK